MTTRLILTALILHGWRGAVNIDMTVLRSRQQRGMQSQKKKTISDNEGRAEVAALLFPNMFLLSVFVPCCGLQEIIVHRQVWLLDKDKSLQFKRTKE